MKGNGIFAAALLAALVLGEGFGQGLDVSGLLDSTVGVAGDGGGGSFAYDWEEYANLRMRVPVGEYADFYGAVNAVAAAGSVASVGSTGRSAFIAGENYAFALELERLYLRLKGEVLGADLGLMRLGFGYGQALSPSDFLNPRNPLFPDARPRAILGAALAAYPQDSLKLQAFTAAPRNPLSPGGEGFIAGLSADKHGDFASIQVLYAFESPREGYPQGVHRGGVSLKADLELGFAADLLYTGSSEGAGIGGLAVDGGFDYSFLDGDWYVLVEYLYSGEASSTARSGENPLGLAARHNLLGTVVYHINDYTQAALTGLFGLEEGSSAGVLSLDHELFQGLTLTLSGQAALDGSSLEGCSTTARLRLRF